MTTEEKKNNTEEMVAKQASEASAKSQQETADTRAAEKDQRESDAKDAGARQESPSRGRNGGDEGRDSDRKKRKGPFRKSRRGQDRPRPEFETKVLSARRVSRVVAGGRRFSLSVAIAIGNKKGKVGIGTGKGQDMATAAEKARNQAHKKLVQIPVTNTHGIANEATGKYCASIVHIRPAKSFVAGGAVRAVAELAGIQQINAKILSRSKSHLNNARAALRAFSSIKEK